MFGQMPLRAVLGLFLGCVLLLPAGCGGDSNGDSASDEAQAQADAVKEVPGSALPPLGLPLPPLDGGAIEIATPKDWNVTRQNQFLAVLYEGRGASPPRILVTKQGAADAPAPTATRENIASMVPYIAKRIGSKAVVEPPKAMILGDQPVVRYVKSAAHNGMGVDSQVLCLLRQGVLYEINLQVYKGDLVHIRPDGFCYRDDAYAVAAGVKFSDQSPPADTDAPASPPSGEAPAE